MPTLYSGLHLLSHDKPSYVSYERFRPTTPLFPDYAFVYPVAESRCRSHQRGITGNKRSR